MQTNVIGLSGTVIAPTQIRREVRYRLNFPGRIFVGKRGSPSDARAGLHARHKRARCIYSESPYVHRSRPLSTSKYFFHVLPGRKRSFGSRVRLK